MEDAAVLETLEQVLAERGEAWLAPHGISMGRRYAGAEALLIRRAAGKAPRWGTFIVVRSGASKWVAHRVIAVWQGQSGPRFLTKGDGRVEADWPPRERADWMGDVVAVRKDGAVWRLDGWRSMLSGRLRAAFGLACAAAWELVRTLRGRRRV